MASAPQQDSLGRFVRADGTPAPPPDKSVKRKRRPSPFKHFRVDSVLTDPEQRCEYERLLSAPATTVDQLRAWLAARGHRVCRSAIGRHRRVAEQFRSVRECAQMAAAFCDVTRNAGSPTAMAEASHTRFEMMLMQSLHKMHGAPQLPREEWESMARLTREAVATRRSVEDMRDEFERRAREAAKAVERMGPKPTGKDVVARMKQILGV
jgi:hypothetical protein